MKEPGSRETIAQLGIIVVEGPNDVIALDALGVPALALCSNNITAEQCGKIAAWARRLGGGNVTLMLDCDPEGENGARHALFELAQHCRVRLAWSSTMFGGRCKGRQPESLTADEWKEIRARIVDVVGIRRASVAQSSCRIHGVFTLLVPNLHTRLPECPWN